MVWGNDAACVSIHHNSAICGDGELGGQLGASLGREVGGVFLSPLGPRVGLWVG